MLLVKKQMRTAEGQEAANKCGYGSWDALLGQEVSDLIRQPLECPQGSALGKCSCPIFFPPAAKELLQEFEVIAQGRFCHLIK